MAEQPNVSAANLFGLRASGASDIDKDFSPGRPYRLCHLRAHFAANPTSSNPSTSPAVLTLSLKANAGDEFDLDLYKFIRGGGVGIGRDAHAVFAQGMGGLSWNFETLDVLRVRWINPGGVRWGVELGIVGIG